MADVWANSMACHPRATCYSAGCCHLANQCHDPRATYHIAGCCNRANSMAWHPRATYHIAGCCHFVNSLSWFQSHMPHCRCSHLAKSMSYSCHIACCKNSNRHIENRFSPYFIFFRFLKCSLDFDERQLPYCLRYTYYYYYCQTLNIVCQPHWAVNRIPDVFDFVENFAVTQGQSVIRICTVE